MKILIVSTLKRSVKATNFASRSRIIYQLAEGMRMHNEARGGAVSAELIDQTITLLGFDEAKLHFLLNLPY